MMIDMCKHGPSRYIYRSRGRVASSAICGRVFLGLSVPDAADGVVLSSRAYYDRVAFVPQRESDTGALAKYFGKVPGNDEFKSEGSNPDST